MYDEGPSRKYCLHENWRSNVMTKNAHPLCQLIVGVYRMPFMIDVNPMHVKDEANHTPLLSRNGGGLCLFRAKLLCFQTIYFHLPYADYHWDCSFPLSWSLHKVTTLIPVPLHHDLFIIIRYDLTRVFLLPVLLHRDLCMIQSATSTTFLGRYISTFA